MMKTMRTVFLIILVSAALASPPKAKAGWPVIDVTHIMQTIVGYIADLSDYATQLNQLQKDTQAYAQMLKDYQQTMREYRHYLNQIKGIKHLIEEKDWKRIVKVAKNGYGKMKRSSLPNLDPEHDSYEKDVKSIVKDTQVDVAEEKDYNDLVQQSGFDVSKEARTYRRAKAAWNNDLNAHQMVSSNQKLSEERKQEIAKLSQAFEGLGDEDDLKTMQHIALSQHMLMKQNEILINLQNQALSESTRDKEYERWLKEQQMKNRLEMQRIKEFKERRAEVQADTRRRWLERRGQ
jgi:hypothetical protein